ncbi:MAG: D-alanyl-D-alanine carboxypeptidase/D-alanyl-D-alanine-endopeptidase [bacterium]|nr:D-alanyl-D-alanine carboxypeptidase/D-alanyl-D-alanine-endopeptidase [bacterium]
MYRNIDVGIRIQAIGGDEVLYDRNSSTAFMPASTIKIITSGVSLIKFGPHYRFKTPLLTDGILKDGVLEGNLYIQGRGDPALKQHHLQAACRALYQSGLRSVRGDIVYDTSFLDKSTPRYAPNARHYYAPPGAITVNYNWLETKLEKGPPVKLTTIPATSYARLDYSLRVTDSMRPGRPKMTYQKMPWGDLYSIKGTTTKWDQRYKYLQLCVTRPGLFAATLLKEALIETGIQTSGKITAGLTPASARVLHTIETPELLESMVNLNRESNNVIAELINKDLGAYFGTPPGTTEKGLSIIRRFCSDELGFVPGEFTLADASGLSRSNRLSARQFTAALNYFYNHLGDTFVETLAPQGHHHHAMHPVPPKGMRIFVKSGTLSATGVNAVAGYIFLDKSKRAFTFAILCNRRGSGALAYSGTFTNPILTAVVEAFSEKQKN